MLAFRCCDGASNTDLARTGVGPATALDSSVRRSIVVNRQPQGRVRPSGVVARRMLLNQKYYPHQTKG